MLKNLLKKEKSNKPKFRKTVKRSGSISGIGIHSGDQCTLVFHPAEAGNGSDTQFWDCIMFGRECLQSRKACCSLRSLCCHANPLFVILQDTVSYFASYASSLGYLGISDSSTFGQKCSCLEVLFSFFHKFNTSKAR